MIKADPFKSSFKKDTLHTYRDPTDHDIPSNIKKWVNMTTGKEFVLNETWEEVKA